MTKKKKVAAIIGAMSAVLLAVGLLVYFMQPKPAMYADFSKLNVTALGYLSAPISPNPIINKDVNQSSNQIYNQIEISPKGDYFAVYKPKKISFEVYSAETVTLGGNINFDKPYDIPFFTVDAGKTKKIEITFTGHTNDSIIIQFVNNLKIITVFNTKIEVA